MVKEFSFKKKTTDIEVVTVVHRKLIGQVNMTICMVIQNSLNKRNLTFVG